MRKKYGSDISRKQFELIKPLLESARKKTRPRELDLYEVFCGVLYLLKSGCQWRMLPSDFPKWRSVHSYFSQWSAKPEEGMSLSEQALKKSGWRGPRETGAQVQNKLRHHRRAKRQKYRLKWTPKSRPQVRTTLRSKRRKFQVLKTGMSFATYEAMVKVYANHQEQNISSTQP